MKLDLDYVKNILLAIENNERPNVAVKDIAKAINTDLKNQKENEIFVYYMEMLTKEIGALETDQNNMGITKGLNDPKTIMKSVEFRLSFSGHKLLDAMKNETIFNKIKSISKVTGIELLKQLPSLALDYFMKAS